MRKSGIWTLSYRPDGEWNRAAEMMMLQFAESGHLFFRGTRPLSRGTLKSKGGGKTCMAEPLTAELLLTAMTAVHQLSMYGAVAKWCHGRSPPQLGETQVKESAVREVAPHQVRLLTKHRTLDNLARGNEVPKLDEEF